MASALTALGSRALRDGLMTKKFSAREVIAAYLRTIEEREADISSFLAIDRQGAEATADALDRQIAAGQAVPSLAGSVVAVKDNIVVQELPTTAGSRILEGYLPPYEATVIFRLRAAGAIILGKTNLDEFAMGASTEHSAYHQTYNPHDRLRVPGGSSGGSAAAVAAKFCTVALGSDTGGSVRQPAAFCGLVGMRPTYGTVSRNGLIAMASSMDVIGPLARSVDDCRRLLSAIAGYDPADATTVPHHQIPAANSTLSFAGLRIGVPGEYVDQLKSGPVMDALNMAKRILADQKAEVLDVSLPTTAKSVPTYYVITPAESSSNLARYDGIRFGYPKKISPAPRGSYARYRGERFGAEPKRRILLGTYTLSAGYTDQYYRTAQRVRTLIRQDFANAFRQVDLLLTPTTPTPAFEIGAIQDPIDMYNEDIFLSAVSLAGLPAINLPVPIDSHLPVGIQLIAPPLQDDLLLRAAAALTAAWGP